MKIFITLFFLMASPLMATLSDGVYAAALVPMHADLSCNSPELVKHCKDLLARGCQGVALFGTTGEGCSFSLRERLEALEIIFQQIDPKKIILANGSASIDDTVALASYALAHGCKTLLIAPPCFFKNVPEEGVIAFYRTIIQRVADPDLKVILYHIPQFTGVPLTLGIIQVLCQEFPQTIIGMKESEGNLAFAKTVIAEFPGFKVFVGNERQIIEAVQAGAAGSICGVANLYPELICSLYNAGKQGHQQNPPELENFFCAMKSYPFVTAFKAVMEKRKGANWHVVRPPLVPLSPEERAKFISQLQMFKLD